MHKRRIDEVVEIIAREMAKVEHDDQTDDIDWLWQSYEPHARAVLLLFQKGL